MFRVTSLMSRDILHLLTYQSSEVREVYLVLDDRLLLIWENRRLKSRGAISQGRGGGPLCCGGVVCTV